MLNSFLNPNNNVSLTGIVNITADKISLIQVNEDLGVEEIKNIENIFLQYQNISTVEDITVPIGGGLSYTIKQWIEPVTDEQVAGLSSLLDYLNTNYRRIDDDSCITNNYYITKKNNNIINKNDTFNYHKHNYITQVHRHQNIHKQDTFNYNKKQYVSRKNFYETHLKSDTFNYNKKVENKHIVVKQVPTYINQENNYTFIKHNNQQLLDMIANLQQQINNLQQQINNLP